MINKRFDNFDRVMLFWVAIGFGALSVPALWLLFSLNDFFVWSHG
jgi:hypothetical protein